MTSGKEGIVVMSVILGRSRGKVKGGDASLLSAPLAGRGRGRRGSAGMALILLLALGGLTGCQSLSDTFQKYNPFTNILPKDEPTHSFRTKAFGTSALLDEASRFYFKGDFIEARGEYKRFLELHPTHPLAAFAQYRIGMCDFYQIGGIDRDPSPTEKALADFQKVIDEYPDSPYVEKAQKKVAFCRERKARLHFYVGSFYYRTKFYKAAAYRFHTILLKYPDSKIYPRAQYNYAKALFHEKKREKAAEVMRTIVSQSPGTFYARKAQILLDYWKRRGFIS